jgi:mRNA-degrading endonuclease RelE of RelBE toxin-antitoxin system
MKHFASPSFWEQYKRLPKSVQELADKNFELLKADSKHPSLHLKKTGRYWSVRVGIKYRALGIEIDEGMLWFWIGTHADYDQMIEK